MVAQVKQPFIMSLRPNVKVSLHLVIHLLEPLFSQFNIIQLALQFRIFPMEKDLGIKLCSPFLIHLFKPWSLGIVEPNLLWDLKLVV